MENSGLYLDVGDSGDVCSCLGYIHGHGFQFWDEYNSRKRSLLSPKNDKPSVMDINL